MNMGTITLVIVASLLVLLVTGFPVAFSLLAVAIAGVLIWVSSGALFSLATVTFTSTSTDYFIALPMFIFMAAILEFSGVGTALYEMMYKWMAGLRGGLAMGTVLISTMLAAVSGVAATSVVSLGMLAYPEMKIRGYSKEMSIGPIVAGGCLGPLIPPSIPMIIVAGLSSVSIGRLFISGIIPGLLIAALFIIYIGVRCFRNPALGPPVPAIERVDWRQKFIILYKVIIPVALIILILGGIYSGICTPSEAGGVGAFGALLCAATYRKLNLKTLRQAVIAALRVNTLIFWLIIGGVCFSSMLSLTGVRSFIVEILTSTIGSPWVILVIMLSIVYLMGMFMDATAIAIICIPVFIPIVRAIGFDELWFSLIFVMDLIIGYITPPFGINMFYFKGLGYPEVSMVDIYRSTFPFVIILTLGWIVCILFPSISMWLPNMMIK